MPYTIEIVGSTDDTAIVRISGKDEPTQVTEYMHLNGHLDCVQDVNGDGSCVVINANIHDFKWSHVPMDVVVKCICADGMARHEVHAALGTSLSCSGAHSPMSWAQRFQSAIQYAEQMSKEDLTLGLIWIEAPSSLEWNTACTLARSCKERIDALRSANFFIAIERDDLPRFAPVHDTVQQGYGACMLSDRGQFDLGDVRNNGLGTLWTVSPLIPRSARSNMVDEWLQWLMGTAQRTTPTTATVDVQLPTPLSYSARLQTLIGINKGTAIDFAASQSTRTLRITLPAGGEYDVLATFAKEDGVLESPRAISSTFTDHICHAVMDCASKDPEKAGAAVFYLYSIDTKTMPLGCTSLIRNAILLANSNFPSPPPVYPGFGGHIPAPKVLRHASGI